MSIKNKVYYKFIQGIRLLNISRRYKIVDDARQTAPFKLLYFCGQSGIEYLNASLLSVYKNWSVIPEIIIATDGTPVQFFKEKLIKWPRKAEIILWEDCAKEFKNEGNTLLYDYASKEVFGKKFVSILYHAKRGPVLYSDTDILWFNTPAVKKDMQTTTPQIVMSRDVDHFYTKELLETLGEEHCMNNIPFNAGVIYVEGQFSGYPKWNALSKYLGTAKDLGWFSEQTTFAILQNHFNPNTYWKSDEILIKIDDAFKTRYTLNDFPGILARHYVSVKNTAFWRDFFIMSIKGLRNRSSKNSSLKNPG